MIWGADCADGANANALTCTWHARILHVKLICRSLLVGDTGRLVLSADHLLHYQAPVLLLIHHQIALYNWGSLFIQEFLCIVIGVSFIFWQKAFLFFHLFLVRKIKLTKKKLKMFQWVDDRGDGDLSAEPPLLRPAAHAPPKKIHHMHIFMPFKQQLSL